ncbi:MAG: hypothetical protein WC718_13520 [Phycisphaerales bacterium]
MLSEKFHNTLARAKEVAQLPLKLPLFTFTVVPLALMMMLDAPPVVWFDCPGVRRGVGGRPTP